MCREVRPDLIDALAIARAALREPVLDSPRPEEAPLRELKLLVDHRDDLVDERRRAQQRLRWHLHELEPTLRVPLGALDRAIWLERLSRQLARREQTTQVRIARELLGRCRTLPARSSSSTANCRHRIAITQGRVHKPARAYLERKQTEGKSRREALRCLKRQLARTVYTILKNEPLLT